MEILTVTTPGRAAAWQELIGPYEQDTEFCRRMWEEAETRFEDQVGGAVWSIATVRDGDRWVAAAWAAADPGVNIDLAGREVLLCHSSYEVPAYRGLGLYGVAYALRHAAMVLPAAAEGLPALTYVFEAPLARHLADGWQVTLEGDSDEPDAPSHHWWELHRPADR